MKRCPKCRRVYEDRAAFCQIDRAALDRLGVDSLIGKAVTPRCRLIRKLGGGGLGTVYLGEEVATGNRVAVKVLLKELAVDDDVLKHCWWDARFATASRPSNIVRVYEVDRTDEGRACIVMEYLEGENLADVIRREGALEPGRALNLASQIAESLAAASKAGVAHGNLKPQDVMVVGPNERVKVTGFGVARLLETVSSGGLASRNVVSPEYSAPEQRRDGDASDATDIYSLGAVLYTMLTGTAPLIASNRGAADLEDGPAPLRTLRPSVPIAIEHFVTRAMAPQPERRQSGLGECVESLQTLTDALITGVVAESRAAPVSDTQSEGGASRSQMAPALVATERESSRVEFRPSRLTSWKQTLTKPLGWRPSGGWKRAIVAVAHLSQIDAPWLGRAGKLAIPTVAALVVAGGMVWAALDRGSVPTPAAPVSTKRAAEPEGKVDAAPQTKSERPDIVTAPEPTPTAATPPPPARPAEPMPAAPLELSPGPIPPTPAASTPKAAPRGTPTISAQEGSRIRTQAEQQLLSRGLDRVSGADRWSATPDIASSGTVPLGGGLRDMDAGGD
jgi:predicted Ser/Thr protein kinase